MAELKSRHYRALELISKKTLTRHELRLLAKFNPATNAEVLETLTTFGLIHPLKDERGEGIRLTQKGSDVTATHLVMGLQLTQ